MAPTLRMPARGPECEDDALVTRLDDLVDYPVFKHANESPTYLSVVNVEYLREDARLLSDSFRDPACGDIEPLVPPRPLLANIIASVEKLCGRQSRPANDHGLAVRCRAIAKTESSSSNGSVRALSRPSSIVCKSADVSSSRRPAPAASKSA